MIFYSAVFIFCILLCTSATRTCGENAIHVDNQLNQCQCKGGYYGSQSDADSGVCKECPQSTTSISNTYSDVSSCSRCKEDYYRSVYSTLGQAAQCVKCPNNSLTLHNNGEQTEEACNVCQENHFLVKPAENGHAAICQKCGSGLTSDFNRINCICEKSGFYEKYKSNENGECVPCPNNTSSYYNEQRSIKDCSFCLEGYYQTEESSDDKEATCLKCPNYSKTSRKKVIENLSDCSYCFDNHYVVQYATENSSAICVKCPDNSHLSNQIYLDVSDCTCKDKYANRLTVYSPYCTCRDGFGGGASVESPCQELPLNYNNTFTSSGNLLIISISLIKLILCF